MKHWLLMLLFSAVTGIVFALVGQRTPRARLSYWLKIFAEFMVVGLALAWLFYFIPS